MTREDLLDTIGREASAVARAKTAEVLDTHPGLTAGDRISLTLTIETDVDVTESGFLPRMWTVRR